MTDQELAKIRRRSWVEIHEYYLKGTEQLGLKSWALLRDFSYSILHRTDLQPLTTSGSLGCIFVYKDGECDPKTAVF